MSSSSSCVSILGVPVAALTADEALAVVDGLVVAPCPARVTFVNANTLNLAWEHPDFRRVVLSSDLVLNDGVGVAIAARVNRQRFTTNLNGSDFTPRILQLAARRGWTVFLLGGRPGVAERARDRLMSSIPGLVVVGCHHGYVGPVDDECIAGLVRSSGAVILLVAMGNPLQEMWLHRCLNTTGAQLGVGVGAFFDFSSGELSRAPSWMNRLGVEWMFRLMVDPRRLWRRYVVGNAVFLFRVLRSRTRARQGR